ncbi:hypothetical protein SUGI_0638090 [Cryptomeria japonica]|uniref:embryo-specific protein ATS3A isoform X2 n=1 Tax=Cryptomeria japonica TaxID=3369 RepID=UPI002414C4C0|nr:embryo-specific protein ATS3A isoform X2 [Cryptomeria japonica]GLJ31730.1 hypothetical protein SUGI_0638090 [Cryptomeria japonica]
MADSQSQFLLSSYFMLAFIFISHCKASSLQPQIGNPREAPLTTRESEKLESCSYTVQIKTSCSAFAGTDDRISIAFGDAFGNQVYVARLDDPTTDTFERCSTDSFTILGPCVYKVCYLYLMRVGSDAWKPEWVRVYYGRSQSVSFIYDMFIPDNIWYGFDLCNTVAQQSALSM